MQRPPDSVLLDGWERGRLAPRAARTLPVLSACGCGDAEGLAGLALGRRNLLLLELREALLGPRLEARLACPACGEELELGFDVGDLPAEAGCEEALVEHGPYRVTLRPLCTADLVASGTIAETEEAERLLLDRCIVRAEKGGAPLEAADLPDPLRKEIAARLPEIDPAADLRIATRCPACDHGWVARLDVDAFVWAELDHLARRVLGDIDALARAYGWTEPQILELSAERRRHYLELASA